MSTAPMRELELVALKKDMNAVLECLGHAGCFQIKKPTVAPPAASGGAAGGGGEYRDALDKLEELRLSLGLRYPERVPELARLPGPGEEASLASMLERARALDASAQANADAAARLRAQLEEASVFEGLEIPYDRLEEQSFLAVRIGSVEAEALPGLREILADRAVVLPFGKKGDVVAVSSRKGRFALDTELSRAGFSPRQFSPGFSGVAAELPASLEARLAELEIERRAIEARRDALREELALPWLSLAASYAVASSVEEARLGLAASRQAYKLEGWVPESEVEGLCRAINERTSGRVALRSYKPAELEAVRSGEEEVPVLLRSRRFVSSFERMVLSFGTPQYGSVDPTPFVAVYFITFFTIMFGDLGQGFLILAGSLAIYSGLWKRLAKWKRFAPIGAACGMGSMLMGSLTGSCFTFENLLVPFTRGLSAALLGHPVDRFLTIMPEGGSNKILYFFGFTLALGVITNSTGLAINIVDRLRAGKIGEALFAKTGLAGALLFWWAVGIGARSFLGSKLAWFDALGLGLPALCLLFEDPLRGAVEGRPRGAGDGAFAAAVKGFVALLESVSYFLSTSLSFLRVGAFALSHVVLSFIVFTMGDMVRQAPALGFLWQALVVLVGNSIILFLEGLIVAIQIVRLQYYEFMSKFLTETGPSFVPFKFQFRKEEP